MLFMFGIKYRKYKKIYQSWKFIKTFIEKGNTIISDGWVDYQNLENEGYHHDVHILGGGDFGFGLNSTSTIESLWNALKKN